MAEVQEVAPGVDGAAARARQMSALMAGRPRDELVSTAPSRLCVSACDVCGKTCQITRHLRFDRRIPTYEPVMNERKARLEITVDPHLSAYAEHLVATGKAPSLSAVVNDALSEKERRDRQALDRLKETAAQADRRR